MSVEEIIHGTIGEPMGDPGNTRQLKYRLNKADGIVLYLESSGGGSLQIATSRVDQSPNNHTMYVSTQKIYPSQVDLSTVSEKAVKMMSNPVVGVYNSTPAATNGARMWVIEFGEEIRPTLVQQQVKISEELRLMNATNSEL